MEVSGEALAILAGNAWDRNDAIAKERLIEQGYTITTPDEAFLQEIETELSVLAEDWKERVAPMGVDGQLVIDAFKEHIEQAEQELN